MLNLSSPSVSAPRTRTAARWFGPWLALVTFGAHSAPATPPPWSPSALAITSDARTLFIACATAEQVITFDVGRGTILRTTPVPHSPSGLAISADGSRLFVTCAAPESAVGIIDVATGRLEATLQVGHTAMSPVPSPDGKILYVCNRFDSTVSIIDLGTQRETSRIVVAREPMAADVTPDGKYLLVAHHLHQGRADADRVAATVSVIDTATRTVAREIRLPNGSGLLHDVRLSPDGRHALVTHQISRYYLPTTQVERGWINTNAVSVIDTQSMRLINSVLLDSIDSGAANPWAVAWSADGRTFGVTHAGTHELSVVDFPALLAKLTLIAAAPAAADVPNDLSFLVGVRRRIRLGAADRGPRAVVLAGTRAWVANYFSDSLTVVDFAAPEPAITSLPLRAGSPASLARRGEDLFNDASLCFQGWQSCASCHSSDARVDGLNWDNLNDGIGNPKNAKSLLLTHQTPPAMWLHVRDDAGVAVRAGLRFGLFMERPEADAVALDEYLQSLNPIPSPHLVRGQLSPAAQRGRQLFFSQNTGCAECHPPNLYTDLKPYDVGTRNGYDQRSDQFDTPTLIEIWRSGPYLHDGSAASVREVLTTRNRADRHGHTTQLAPREIDDLVEFILSL